MTLSQPTLDRLRHLAGRPEIPEGTRFQRARALVRAALTEAGIAPEIDRLVARLLNGA